jgi:hypothetical protein
MDLLGVFKEKIGFLKIKKIFKPPLYRSSHTGSPDRVRLGHQQPRAWPSPHWLPQEIRRDVVRLGAVHAGMWPRREWFSHSGSWRIGYGHASMWPPVHKTIPVFHQ